VVHLNVLELLRRVFRSGNWWKVTLLLMFDIAIGSIDVAFMSNKLVGLIVVPAILVNGYFIRNLTKSENP
jgi:hypothetical protein